MESIKVFGHKNPDLDSIAASLAVAHLLNKQEDISYIPCILGELNKEARFVFNKFNLTIKLENINKIEDKESVILVDHNEFSQSVQNIENAKIKMVIDHHKIDNFRTSEALEYICKPVGSTSTIVYNILNEEGFLDNFEVNILLLSGIISDTLLFKSPTTTSFDRESAEQLAKMLDLDIETYGLELLKAGADLSDLTSDELINIDSKEFDCNRN